MSKDLWDRLWSRVDRSGDCWIWTGARDRHGYGQIWDREAGHHRTVPRVVWELTRGPIEANVLHHCDNPPCVRPTHLFAGDQRANMLDASAKGRLKDRNGPPAGENHPRSKLTDAQVYAVKARYLSGESPIAIAREFGVRYATVWAIGTGRSRKWAA